MSQIITYVKMSDHDPEITEISWHVLCQAENWEKGIKSTISPREEINQVSSLLLDLPIHVF